MNSFDIYNRAERDLKSHLDVVETWNDFLLSLDQKKLIMAPFCGGKACEDKLKKDSAR
jgi:prolyl-tRNA synthetase